MCGLTGFWRFSSHIEKSSIVIQEMAKLQKHRGPDDSSYAAIRSNDFYIEEFQSNKHQLMKPCDIMFGFNRLSILDLSVNGRQPMIDKESGVVFMLNGEIYNAFKYKDYLKEKGYSFKSNTDTEVAMYMYIEFGIDKMLSFLNGMFAIVIWDAKLKKLILIRDRFGIKPLYYYQNNEVFAFSSELKSFKALKEIEFELNTKGIDEFLIFRNLINDTLIRGIKNCEPGSYLEITNDGKNKKTKYYDINKLGNEGSVFNQSEFENCLSISVKSQMLSDVKLGCQLSGGVDSSLVTFFAKEHLEENNLETISILFRDSNYSEEEYINQVISQLNIIGHKYFLDYDYYLDKMEEVTWHFEQPINHPNTIGIYLLSQMAKNHVTVLLSGEGADEILGGYGRFKSDLTNPYLSRKIIGEIYSNLNTLSRFLRIYMNPVERYIISSAYLNLSMAYNLYDYFNIDSALERRRNIWMSLSGDLFTKRRKYEVMSYLPDLLMRQDKMSMAHSIENRVPFLDNDFVNLAINSRTNDLLNYYDGKIETKLALKKVCMDKFGKQFAFRNKMGFGIPLGEFVNNKTFQRFWFSYLEPKIKERAIFNIDKVSGWVKGSSDATNRQLDAIWLMVVFELWAIQYLDD